MSRDYTFSRFHVVTTVLPLANVIISRDSYLNATLLLIIDH